MAKNPDKERGSLLSQFFEDLTHLQIDTIVKSGMTSAEPPERVEEMLFNIQQKYVRKLSLLVSRNDIEYENDILSSHSFLDLDKHLIALQTHMDSENLRMTEQDYILFLRMKSFTRLIESRCKAGLFTIRGRENENINTVDLSGYEDFQIENVSIRDRARFKKYHDLGMETIVLQTRFGIDGDVVTRIEEGFAGKPRELVINLHEKHIRLSTEYWKGLIDTVISFVRKIPKALKL